MVSVGRKAASIGGCSAALPGRFLLLDIFVIRQCDVTIVGNRR